MLDGHLSTPASSQIVREILTADGRLRHRLFSGRRARTTPIVTDDDGVDHRHRQRRHRRRPGHRRHRPPHATSSGCSSPISRSTLSRGSNNEPVGPADDPRRTRPTRRTTRRPKVSCCGCRSPASPMRTTPATARSPGRSPTSGRSSAIPGTGRLRGHRRSEAAATPATADGTTFRVTAGSRRAVAARQGRLSGRQRRAGERCSRLPTAAVDDVVAAGAGAAPSCRTAVDSRQRRRASDPLRPRIHPRPDQDRGARMRPARTCSTSCRTRACRSACARSTARSTTWCRARPSSAPPTTSSRACSTRSSATTWTATRSTRMARPRRLVTNTDYARPAASWSTADPRTISNLIVDQTANNPAAVRRRASRRGRHLRHRRRRLNDGVIVTSPGLDGVFGTADDIATSSSFPNVAPDAGLSAPFNAVVRRSSASSSTTASTWSPRAAAARSSFRCSRTIRSTSPGSHDQLHGADARHQPARAPTASSAPPTTSTSTPTPTSPFVDQNQTYTSHPSHQVFLRAYELDADGEPVATGKLIDEPRSGRRWRVRHRRRRRARRHGDLGGGQGAGARPARHRAHRRRRRQRAAARDRRLRQLHPRAERLRRRW